MMKRNLLLLIFGVFSLLPIAMAQQKTVTGRVVDASNGNVLAGVTVTIKGTSKQVTTNSQGNFSIEVSTDDVLVFRFVGMQTKEEPITTSTTSVTVPLSFADESLEEVVVTAFGMDRDKKSLGYSTPTVSGVEVSETQREGFFAGLQGRVPGLSVNSTSGNPGASAQIVLRGFVSISGNNNALIVIDGVPVDNSTLNQDDLVLSDANRHEDYSNRALDINPADIESYTILKGPEATALYGSQGASGAIIITTKKAKAGRGAISYNNSFRTETLNRWPERQTTYGPGQNGVYNGATSVFQGPAFPEGTPLYDNFDAFFRTGFTQKHNLAVEGGTDKYTYRWSNEYSDVEGTTPNTAYTRISSRLTGYGEISPILKVTSTFNYINTNNDKARKGPQGYLMSLMRFSPASDVTKWIDEFGNRVTSIGTIYSEYDNPFWDVYRNTSWDKTNRMLANTNVQLTPLKWLFVNGIFGVDYSTTHGESVYHAQSYRGSGTAGDPTGGRFSQYDRITRSLNGSLTVRARHDFGNFNNTYTVGASLDDVQYNTNSQIGYSMFDPDFYSLNNTLPTSQRARNTLDRRRNVGFFGQAVLGYKTIFYLTLSGRLDGASRLMPNNPFFAYPSGSFAFNFTDIKSVKETLPWLNYGKIRASISLTGKEPWRTYSTGSNLEPMSSTGGGFSYSYYGGNPDLKVETTNDFETGIELQFLQSRIGVDFTFYRRLSIDQIILPRLSYGSGFVLRMMNGGDVENKGVEIQLKASPIRKERINWDVTFNYTQNRGTVLSVAEELPELYDSDTWILGGTRTAVHPGYSIGTISGTRFDRNDRGDILISPANGLPTTSDTRYYPIGDRIPKFTLGMVNQFQYRNWSLSFLWDLRYGGDVLNGTEYEAYTRGNSVKTLDREEPRIIKGVLQDGLENTANPTPNNIAVTPYFNSLYYTTNVSPEMFVERNIKALRLRDVTLNYNLPKSLISKIHFVQDLGVFVTATDLLLFTNYSGLDPESNSNTAALGGIGGYGIDYGNLGKPIGMNFGVRVKL